MGEQVGAVGGKGKKRRGGGWQKGTRGARWSNDVNAHVTGG
jgi:hypothetical protein